jgi:hypothetical protein
MHLTPMFDLEAGFEHKYLVGSLSLSDDWEPFRISLLMEALIPTRM